MGEAEVIGRVATDRGEARLLGHGSISRTFEFAAEGRVYRDEWDPRDSGATLLVAPTKWTEPEAEPIDDATHEAILDAFWSLSEKTQAIAHIIEWRPDDKCRVAQRWNRGADGFLARIGEDGVEYLELRRTAFLPHTATSRGSNRVAKLEMSRATWRYPEVRQLDAADQERAKRNIVGAREEDLFFTEPGWIVE